MEISAFKAFKGDFSNKYGEKFELGVVYSKNPATLKFGKFGHGYHVTAKLEDTFRFFNPCLDNVYCEVLGSGKVIKYDDYLYHSDSMYVVEKLEIIKILSREDILQFVYQADLNEFRRYLALFPFTKEELENLRSMVIEKGFEYQQLFHYAMEYQKGDIASFKRNPKYLGKSIVR